MLQPTIEQDLAELTELRGETAWRLQMLETCYPEETKRQEAEKFRLEKIDKLIKKLKVKLVVFKERVKARKEVDMGEAFQHLTQVTRYYNYTCPACGSEHETIYLNLAISPQVMRDGLFNLHDHFIEHLQSYLYDHFGCYSCNPDGEERG